MVSAVLSVLLLAGGFYASAEMVKIGATCTVTPNTAPSTNALDSRDPGAWTTPVDKRQTRPDDTPMILSAFKQCGQNGAIVFEEGVYNIRQVMDTTGLRNVTIDIYGTFVWSADNLQYWISNTFSVTYAGLHTGWLLGGTDIVMRGHGKALFNGNGQVWIDENRDGSNRQGRPINLTIWRATNVLIDGITWRQSQFWHTFVAYSQNVTMTNLDMNTTSNSRWSAVNTDGVDTWNSRDVYIRNWKVTCGDDCISVKGNSTNIDVKNVTCYESGCAVVGSMGSNAGQPDYVENVLFENFTCHHSSNAAWIKTYPGTGRVRNVTFRNFQFDDVNQPIYITPCTYSGSNCDHSRIPIQDISWINVKGTSRYNIAAGMYCSRSAQCQNLRFEGVDIRNKDSKVCQGPLFQHTEPSIHGFILYGHMSCELATAIERR
jgi:galacturan 1,4-alpha-galacturonidase